MDWQWTGTAPIASAIPGDGWREWVVFLTACLTLGSALLKTRPDIAGWIWGIFTANVRAARMDRELQEVREQVDRLYEDLKRERELAAGRISARESGSSPGSSTSPSNPEPRRETP